MLEEITDPKEPIIPVDPVELVEPAESVEPVEPPKAATKTEDGYKIDLTKIKPDGSKDPKDYKGVQEPKVIELVEPTEPAEPKEPIELADRVTKEMVIDEAKKDNIELPDNIQKVVEFMKETGGSLEDYVRLNADYSTAEDNTLLREYYKQTKPHLSTEEVEFLIEDSFSFDEDMDEEKEVRRKKLAKKEAVVNAQGFLTSLKDKYYDEVKLGSKLTPEQKEAIAFKNSYDQHTSKTKELTSRQQEHFKKVTEELFNADFKGFEFNVGDKNYRYNVKDTAVVKANQEDLMNVFKGYIKDDLLVDSKNYHKALFAASNPDGIAKHFYEQGQSDMLKDMNMKAKNVSVDGRQTDPGSIKAGKTTVKVVDGDTSSKLKMKLKNY
jgi:hypothetical protein